MSHLETSPGSEHYRKIKPEPIEVTESWNLGFHLGNAMKYISRHTFKGKPVDDLLKAIWYIKRHLLVNYGVDADNPNARPIRKETRTITLNLSEVYKGGLTNKKMFWYAGPYNLTETQFNAVVDYITKLQEK